MWILLAFGSALFAGLTSILAKCGIKETDSTVATAVRTIIVLLMSCVMVTIVGSWGTLGDIEPKAWIFLILSGLSTGASWLCYFKALQIGDVNKVVPVDKSSTILTLLLAFIFLHESITWIKALCVILIGAGTFLMIEKKAAAPQNGENVDRSQGHSWLLFAGLSAIFAALTSILGKVGISGVESNLGTTIRTLVVLIMAWMMVLVTGKKALVSKMPKKELGFICLSGLATGGSWLCYYKALQDGLASVVVPIDKLSLLVTVAFSYFVFHEKLTKKSALGLVLIVLGTFGMLL